MEFKVVITLGDLMTMAGLAAGSIGLFLTWISMRTGNRQKRAEFLVSMLQRFTSDDEMMTTYYQVEYGKFEYGEEFHESEGEKSLDKLLRFYDTIGKLWEMGCITMEDVRFFAYEYLVVFQDESVGKYMSFLEDWFKKRGMSVRPFGAFQRLGVRLEGEFFQ